jgi:uncharacterized OB-fold protein
MNHCPKCGHAYTRVGEICPVCHPAEVSDPDAKLDDMVERAAVPTLATLFRKAKATGAIKPITGYGGTPAPS